MNKFCLLFSGGIDSFFSIIILKILKYNFNIFYISNWSYRNKKNTIIILKNLSKILNLKIIILNLKNKFNKKVFLKFLKNYNNNKIINIDFYCNKNIKFGIIINYLKKTFYKIITGHYSKINKNKIYLSKDINRDQNYFINIIKKKSKLKTLFILGNSYKINLKFLFYKIYNKIIINDKSSKGICFIGNTNTNFLFLYYLYKKISNIEKIINKFNFLFLYKKINFKISKFLIIKNLKLKNKKLNNLFLKCKTNHSKNFLICKIIKIKYNFILFLKKKKKFFEGQNIIFFYKNIYLFEIKINL